MSKNTMKRIVRKSDFEDEGPNEGTLSSWDVTQALRRRTEREKDLRLREHRRRKSKDRQAA